jgi:hypothetical protein
VYYETSELIQTICGKSTPSKSQCLPSLPALTPLPPARYLHSSARCQSPSATFNHSIGWYLHFISLLKHLKTQIHKNNKTNQIFLGYHYKISNNKNYPLISKVGILANIHQLTTINRAGAVI